MHGVKVDTKIYRLRFNEGKKITKSDHGFDLSVASVMLAQYNTFQIVDTSFS
jgi:hypothetical protein